MKKQNPSGLIVSSHAARGLQNPLHWHGEKYNKDVTCQKGQASEMRIGCKKKYLTFTQWNAL